jgi:multimeric flavodoxin WrbA
MLLGISASDRHWGNCEAAVKSVLLGARRRDIRTAFIRLTDIPIEPCKGCFRCVGKGGACPTEDGLYDLLCHVRSVDTLVLAAPVYFLAPPAKLLALLDRLLTMSGFKDREPGARRAVTITIMGNAKWHGVAEPLINMITSLLGFEIAQSLSLVAEGPGEILTNAATARRLEGIGEALATGGEMDGAGERPHICPVCGSDFFTIKPPSIVCPVCGTAGDLDVYIRENRFAKTGGDVRWGIGWLHSHIDAWVRPSVSRYKTGRKEVLKALQGVKKRYSLEEERGKPDVR